MREQRARAIFYVRVSPFPSLLASPFPSLAPSFDLSLGLSVSQFARLSTVAFFSSCMSTHASLPLSFSLSLSLVHRCTYVARTFSQHDPQPVEENASRSFGKRCQIFLVIAAVTRCLVLSPWKPKETRVPINCREYIARIRSLPRCLYVRECVYLGLHAHYGRFKCHVKRVPSAIRTSNGSDFGGCWLFEGTPRESTHDI